MKNTHHTPNPFFVVV